LDAIVRGEFAENAVRKALTPSEMVSIAAAIEPLERAKAKERQLQGTRAKPSENFSKGANGRALDKVATFAGVSRPTLIKAREIWEAAEAEPEKFGKLLADMDHTGRVDGVHKRLKVIQQAEKIRSEPQPLPGRGPYRVIVADPPWPYEIRSEDPSNRATTPYPQMSIAQVCALPVPSITTTDAVLWLWTTNFHMRNAFAVLDAWGFQERTILTWAKDRMGMGNWLRGKTEHCILAGRGRPTLTLTNQTTLLNAPMRGHSQKPPEFYDLVERLCPAPRYAYLFSRYRHNDRWDCHGDEAPPDDGDDLRRSAP
jgi:N6-adenosine-specific RNA methylase IME4